ncbi:hypothetical protein PAXRUDRAFT_293004 [Paxillus rubicundulus Ve08.2h10]|uniref:Uncharacterized protein n=1 Tax=Paxillus rubicundulus Ve08.2h10 TaxID=930991 RepID=A0A0D0E092_9AGAM|nr:hypothetical protein PAXRUDRAFT_293004 [Paxillus rubicundulus Ve08.2h10]
MKSKTRSNSAEVLDVKLRMPSDSRSSMTPGCVENGSAKLSTPIVGLQQREVVTVVLPSSYYYMHACLTSCQTQKLLECVWTMTSPMSTALAVFKSLRLRQLTSWCTSRAHRDRTAGCLWTFGVSK